MYARDDRYTRPEPFEEEKIGLLEESVSSSSDLESNTSNISSSQDNSEFDFVGQLRLARMPSLVFSYLSKGVLMSCSYFCSVPWHVLFVRGLIFLVPSFLQGHHSREQHSRSTAKTPPTAYLDGMRGLAALFVYFCHYFYQAFIIAEGWGCDDRNYNILKLPFLRILYEGPAAVCVFFVISGYALSYKPLKLIRARSLGDFTTTMSSLTFRRAIRLYLPTAISTLMIVFLLRIGAYELTRDFANDRTYMKNVAEPHPKRMATASEQLWDWLWKMFEFFHLFSWNIYGGQPSYDIHLWTIPVEFRCSLYLFLILLGTARLQTKFRFLVVGGILFFCYRKTRWDLVLFLSGMIIAELDHIRGAHTSPLSLPQDEQTKLQPRSITRSLKSLFWTLLSILGLYFLCQPDAAGYKTPGWIYLTSLIPEWWTYEPFRYWQCVGAVLLVLAVGRSSSWQRIFNSGPVQYLGKISYSLYLMHGPAMHCMGYHWEKWAYGLTGTEGYWYNAGFVLGACFCIPTVIWWADVFWRAVDIPAVKFAKWLEEKCVVKV